jgi:protein-tyrosine phosphatase
VFENILMVCVGNICRSPSAEIILKSMLHESGKDIKVHSAGLGALVGKNVDATARQVLEENGFYAGEHKARQIDESIIAEADLILVMEKSHLDHLSDIAPQARGKAFLLGKWIDNTEIPDPYRREKRAFEIAYSLINESISGWLKYL